MKIICSWHMKFFGRPLVLGEKAPLSDPRETGGVCASCARKVLREDQRDPQEEAYPDLTSPDGMRDQGGRAFHQVPPLRGRAPYGSSPGDSGRATQGTAAQEPAVTRRVIA